MENLNKNIIQTSEEKLINEINSTIFNGELVDIIEVTFAYQKISEGKFLNKTLFIKFAGLDTFESYDQIYKTVSQKISNKITQISKFQKKIKDLPKLSEKGQILDGALNYIFKILTITLIGLPFEIEKAGFDNNLDKEEIEERIKNIEGIEKDLFGGNIRDNKFEVMESYNILMEKYLIYKDNLSPQEQSQFLSYIKQIEKIEIFDKDEIDFDQDGKKLINIQDLYALLRNLKQRQLQIQTNNKNILLNNSVRKDLNNNILEEIKVTKKEILAYIKNTSEKNLKGDIKYILEEIKDKLIEIENILSKGKQEGSIIVQINNKINENINKLDDHLFLLKKEISRKKYVKIFELIFQIYGINKPIIIDERSSIYDGEDALHIPNHDKYDYLEIQNILSLIQHEIETHYLIEANNMTTLGKIRGGGNLIREEGTAMVAAGLLKGIKLEDFNITDSLSHILLGEILEGDHFMEFLKLNNKLINNTGGKPGNIQPSLLRRKRLYPLSYKGVQHKDTSYSRGILQVVDYIKQGGDIKDLYLGKVNFKDIHNLKQLAEKLNTKIHYPQLLGEIIMYVIKNKKFYHSEFLDYIEKKYGFIQFNRNKIEKLNMSNKRKLVEILKLVKE